MTYQINKSSRMAFLKLSGHKLLSFSRPYHLVSLHSGQSTHFKGWGFEILRGVAYKNHTI